MAGKKEAKTEKPETEKTAKTEKTKEKTKEKAKEAVKKERSARAKKKVVVARGKRKQAVARATVREGKGVVRINGLLLNALQSPIEQKIIGEPLAFTDASNYDISIVSHGGGRIGQAQAARTAIARALVEFTQDPSLKQKMLEFDRSLLVEDTRRVEPKKFKGPKARARFTKSYR